MNQKALLILFVLFSISQFSFAQKIEPGKYVLNYPFSEYTQIYNFNKDSVFEFYEHTDNVITIGKGKYILKDSILVLIFEANLDYNKIDTNLCYKITKEYFTFSDTITYSFKITDDNGNPLEGAIVSLYKGNERTTSVRTRTNTKGKTKLKFDKSYNGNIINFTYIGYETCGYLISDSLSRAFEIILKQFQKPVHYINNKTLRFVLRFDENNNFFIKDEWNHWSHFIYKNK
ncbi:MAG TPA: Ig-like domain-containing protein [Ignavibacteria bacterium]|nr:Ig-like domain-containing protein [Ignavibacteria bacterium]